MSKCVPCRKAKGEPFKLPDSPHYPLSRVTPNQPWTNIGLDYLGPIVASDHGKVWVLVITCLTTRAVNLELVTKLSAVAFINALERHICTYG